MTLVAKTVPQLTLFPDDLAGSELIEISVAGVSRHIAARQLVLPIDSVLTLSGMGGSLPGSRQLVAGTGITLIDHGAGSTLEIVSTGGAGAGSGVQDVELAANANTIVVDVATGYLNIQPDVPLTLGGLTAAFDGQMVTVSNVGFGSILTISKNGLGGTPAVDRFRIADDLALVQKQSITFRYSLSMLLWVQV